MFWSAYEDRMDEVGTAKCRAPVFTNPSSRLNLQLSLTKCTLVSEGPKHLNSLDNLRLLSEPEEQHFAFRKSSHLIKALNWCWVEMRSVSRWERPPLTSCLFSLHIKSTLLILGAIHPFSRPWSLIFKSTVSSLSHGLALTRCIHLIHWDRAEFLGCRNQCKTPS